MSFLEDVGNAVEDIVDPREKIAHFFDDELAPKLHELNQVVHYAIPGSRELQQFGSLTPETAVTQLTRAAIPKPTRPGLSGEGQPTGEAFPNPYDFLTAPQYVPDAPSRSGRMITRAEYLRQLAAKRKKNRSASVRRIAASYNRAHRLPSYAHMFAPGTPWVVSHPFSQAKFRAMEFAPGYTLTPPTK